MGYQHAETLAELNLKLANALIRADELAKTHEADSQKVGLNFSGLGLEVYTYFPLSTWK